MNKRRKMSNKAIRELLATIKIFNDYGIVSRSRIGGLVWYYSGHHDRFPTKIGWNISSCGLRVLHPNPHDRAWYEREDEYPFDNSFKYQRASRDHVLKLATEILGCDDWAPSPFHRNHYISQAALDKCIADALEQQKK
jgi:hypothetical protein